jgi:hypothetical protein
MHHGIVWPPRTSLAQSCDGTNGWCVSAISANLRARTAQPRQSGAHWALLHWLRRTRVPISTKSILRSKSAALRLGLTSRAGLAVGCEHQAVVPQARVHLRWTLGGSCLQRLRDGLSVDARPDRVGSVGRHPVHPVAHAVDDGDVDHRLGVGRRRGEQVVTRCPPACVDAPGEESPHAVVLRAPRCLVTRSNGHIIGPTCSASSVYGNSISEMYR